ncbi:DUF6884 domain-containing protein [Enterovibrio norvegicus]|uniref:DUF6884 domain-containing protein n=1 Tax=Enterovibrio norvegicus TaxID=188144 RepID=UPI00105428F7|nr:DUF6884 domain-containing protein [Enterovibrio norvegicus]
MKPILIIGCSNAKGSTARKAIDLYEGAMYQLIRANIENVTESFDVLILSAKHGLIEADQVIAHYDTELPKRTDVGQVSAFVAQHKAKAQSLLKEKCIPGREVFIVLSNGYLNAFDNLICSVGAKRALSKCVVYASRDHRGIGILRGRLKRILLTQGLQAKPPILFRSGVANTDEMLGYLSSGQAIGSSIAYVSDTLKPHLFRYIKDALARGQKVFLDNGMITCLNSGNEFLSHSAIETYRRIISELKPSQSRNLSIVIPDSRDAEEALAIVKMHKKSIKWLARRCRLILPVHRTQEVISDHAANMMSAIDFAPVTLGIPCRKQIKTSAGLLDLRLTIPEIESLFELKNPRTKQLVFRDVHFLALSEVTPGTVYAERMLLARLHSISVSADACRTTAIFGNEATSNRVGSVELRRLDKEIMRANVFNSSNFRDHDVGCEHDSPMVLELLHDAIEGNVFNFVETWNNTVHPAWAMDVTGLNECESREHASIILCSIPPGAFDEILEAFKKMHWHKFCFSSHRPSSFEKRTESITRIFGRGRRIPVQLNMAL